MAVLNMRGVRVESYRAIAYSAPERSIGVEPQMVGVGDDDLDSGRRARPVAVGS